MTTWCFLPSCAVPFIGSRHGGSHEPAAHRTPVRAHRSEQTQTRAVWRSGGWGAREVPGASGRGSPEDEVLAAVRPSPSLILFAILSFIFIARQARVNRT